MRFWVLLCCFVLVCDGTAARKPKHVPAPPPAVAGDVRVHVYDTAKSGKKYDEVVRFLRSIESAQPLPACDRFYGGWEEIRRYIEAVLNNNLLAVGRCKDLKNPNLLHSAFVNGAGSDVPPGYMSLFINFDGVFFDPALEIGGYKGGTREARLTLLFHEIGHGLEIKAVRPDYGSIEGSDFNTMLILSVCRTTIERKQPSLKKVSTFRGGVLY